jgi:type VI secretion system protein VasD
MTMLDRRGFIVAVGAGGLLAACQSGPPKPSSVTVVAAGLPGMNPGPDGGARPVTLQIYRLKSLGAFNAADLLALQADPASALGADLIGVDTLVVPPGGSVSKTIGFEAEAAFLGAAALLRDPSGKTWRASKPIAKESTVTVAAQIGPSGLSL